MFLKKVDFEIILGSLQARLEVEISQLQSRFLFETHISFVQEAYSWHQEGQERQKRSVAVDKTMKCNQFHYHAVLFTRTIIHDISLRNCS
jgi:hypothetical protein